MQLCHRKGLKPEIEEAVRILLVLTTFWLQLFCLQTGLFWLIGSSCGHPITFRFILSLIKTLGHTELESHFWSYFQITPEDSKYLFLAQYLWPQSRSRLWDLHMAVGGSLLYKRGNTEVSHN